MQVAMDSAQSHAQRAFEPLVAAPRGMGLVASGGPVNAVLQWFRLQMDEFASFENAPAPGASKSSALTLFPFAEPSEAKPGDRISVAVSIAKNRLRVWQV